MSKTAKGFTLLSAMLLAVPVMAQQNTVAAGWEENTVISLHADSPTGDRIRTDEVTAGYDFDGDGNMEFLVVGDQTYGPGVHATSGASLWLYEHGALGFSLVWSWIDTTIFQGGASFPVHSVTDLDGDGFQEIILGMPHGSSGGDSTGYVRRFYVWETDANGLPASVGGAPPVPTATWDFEADNRTDNRPSAIATGDFDNDGDEEVAIGFRRWFNSSFGALMIFSLDANGFLGDATGWKIEVFDTSQGYDPAIYSAATTDIDGDGWGEAYFNSDWGIFFEATAADTYTKYGPDYMKGLVDSPEFRHWGVHSAGSWDIDGDGADELLLARSGALRIITGITDLANADTSDLYIVDTLWTPAGESASVRGLSVGDIDNDGKADVIMVGNYGSSLYHMEYKGTGDVTLASSWDNNGMIYQVDTSGIRAYYSGFGGADDNGVFEDLDGDGHTDIVIGFTEPATVPTGLTEPTVAIISDTATTLLRIDPGRQVLSQFRLEQNYPNPFNPGTTVPYSLNTTGQVDLVIFDLLGREVALLYSGIRTPGSYTAKWNGTDGSGQLVATGTYFYRITVDGHSITRKLSLVK